MKQFSSLALNVSDEFNFSAADFSDTQQIRKYNPARLFAFGFMNPRGSVISKGMVFRTFLMCCVATFVANLRCPDKQVGYQFCFPVLNSGDGMIFASLVSFLLGLFVSTTFSRWWSTREKLGLIMNNTIYASMILNNFLALDENAKVSGAKIVRWLNLAHALVYQTANKDYRLESLINDNLLTRDEALLLKDSNNMPVIVYNWCFSEMRELSAPNRFLSATAFSPVFTAITTAYTAAQDVAMFLDTQMPYAYVHLLTLVTKIHIVFIIFYGGGIIATGIVASQWNRIIFGYVVIIASNVIYGGLLLIHDMLVNPFGDQEGDFPKEIYRSNTFNISSAIQNTRLQATAPVAKA